MDLNIKTNTNDLGKADLRILQALRETPVTNIAELTRLTGLGKTTVLRSVANLKSQDMVLDDGEDQSPGGRGRPARGLRLNPNTWHYVGMGIGPGFMTGVLVNSTHQVLAHTQVEVAQGDDIAESGMAAARDLFDQLLTKSGKAKDDLAGIGIALGGPWDGVAGQVGARSLIPMWSEVDILDLFTKTFGVPVAVDNESNCSALAEAQWGNASFDETTLYVKFSHGIGGAIIANNAIVRGHRGRTGEWSHIARNPQGTYCSCGKRGCFVNDIGIDRLLELARPAHGDLTFEAALSLGMNGDPTIKAIVHDMGQAAGELTAILRTVLAPDRIMLGGDLTEFGDIFLTPLKEAVQGNPRDCVPIELASAARLIAGMYQRDDPALGAISLLLKDLARH